MSSRPRPPRGQRAGWAQQQQQQQEVRSEAPSPSDRAQGDRLEGANELPPPERDGTRNFWLVFVRRHRDAIRATGEFGVSREEVDRLRNERDEALTLAGEALALVERHQEGSDFLRGERAP